MFVERRYVRVVCTGQVIPVGLFFVTDLRAVPCRLSCIPYFVRYKLLQSSVGHRFESSDKPEITYRLSYTRYIKLENKVCRIRYMAMKNKHVFSTITAGSGYRCYVSLPPPCMLRVESMWACLTPPPPQSAGNERTNRMEY